VGGRSSESAGVLFVVGMPIGNIDDLGRRALAVLADVDLIACEDTRRIAPLLASHGIRTQTISHFEHNEERRTPALVERMRSGSRVALVTDAGTPTISDPGYRLVRAALKAGIRVAAIPGPSAVSAALSVAGLPTDRFSFEGFLPLRAKARRAALRRLREERRTMVFFESPRRLGFLLADMAEVMGDEREATLAREIGKTHEEIVHGSLAELTANFGERPVLGEVTLVVAGAPEPEAAAGLSASVNSAAAMPVTVEMLREAGLSLKQASAVIARLSGRGRREVYQAALASRRIAEPEG
jgi:16S rRNA (cytidine1402-2'-O)-methyltransferase